MCSLRRGLTKTESSDGNSDVGELFGITRKFAGEDAEQLIENGLGHNELILFLDDPSQCRFATPARENQSRDENVGIEDDLHSSR